MSPRLVAPGLRGRRAPAELPRARRGAVPYVTQLGFTHLEILPISEHPFDGSWGYQAIGYYAPTSRFGTPDDFQWFVDRCHAAGLGVILDWVPAHFSPDAHGLAAFDGTPLYEYADPRRGAHHGWGTLVFDYGRAEVRAFLLDNACFWIEKYHIDGVRVDGVSSMLYLDYERPAGAWLPNRYGGREHLEAIDFLQHLNVMVHAQFPGVVTIAEEATAWPDVTRPVYAGGLGFDLKWNMGWMHDLLAYVQTDPLYRRYEHARLTFALQYAFSEDFVLPLSHDEVVHLKRSLLSKMPGAAAQQVATLRALYAYMLGHPGKKLLFMGGEFAQWREWDHDRGLDWALLEQPAHAGVQRLVADLNALYRQEPALHRVDSVAGFEWLQVKDPDNSVVAWARRGDTPGDEVVVIANWTPVVREDYWLRVAGAGMVPRSGEHGRRGVRRQQRGQSGWGGSAPGRRWRVVPAAALAAVRRVAAQAECPRTGMTDRWWRSVGGPAGFDGAAACRRTAAIVRPSCHAGIAPAVP